MPNIYAKHQTFRSNTLKGADRALKKYLHDILKLHDILNYNLQEGDPPPAVLSRVQLSGVH